MNVVHLSSLTCRTPVIIDLSYTCHHGLMCCSSIFLYNDQTNYEPKYILI